MVLRHRKSAGLFIWRFSYVSVFSVFPRCRHENRYNLRSCAISSQLVDGVRQFPHIVAQLFRFRFRLIRTLVGLVTNTVDDP